MRLCVIGTIIFVIGLMLLLIIRFSPPSWVKGYNKDAKWGCLAVLIMLSLIGGIVIMISHYLVAGIPWVMKLW